MGLHSILKSAKIAEGLFVHFLKKGFHDVGVSIREEKEETTFTVTLHKKDEEIIKAFKEKLYCNRDMSVEEYGWEVMVYNDSDFKLDYLGCQIDSYEITETDDGYIITMKRRRH